MNHSSYQAKSIVINHIIVFSIYLYNTRYFMLAEKANYTPQCNTVLFVLIISILYSNGKFIDP